MSELGGAQASMHEMFRTDAGRVLAAVADALDAAEPPTRAERALGTLQASEKALLGGDRAANGMAAHVRRYPVSLPRWCETRTGPAAEVKSARRPPNRPCPTHCAAPRPWPPCAPT